MKDTMQDRSNLVKQNPLYDILLLAKTIKLEPQQGLERVYHIGKSNKVLKTLRNKPGLNNDLSKLDHNRVLDLYPEYEYIYGPYVDSNQEEFNTVYLLFTNRVNQTNKLQVLYAGRVLQEHDTNQNLPYCESMRTEAVYRTTLDARDPLPRKLSNNCYYREYRWSEAEIAAIKQIYNAVGVRPPSYNALRENFSCGIMFGSNQHGSVNPYRLLYEIHHSKKRLEPHQVVSPVNGKKADLRTDNVVMRDLEEEDRSVRKEALEVYGLDTYKLEKIYARKGFNRFRGIYTYDEALGDNGLQGRRYVKLVRDGTDEQHTILLSRALMTVKEGRLLSDDETVDHIDHDNQNDALVNLRIVNRSSHTASDSVRLEIDPIVCGCCGKTFIPESKIFSYFKLNASAIPYCRPQCQKKLQSLTEEERVQKLAQKKITFRYYVLDKVTKQPRYFPPELSYKECRASLMNNGDTSFTAA